jgi:hypothetical protein
MTTYVQLSAGIDPLPCFFADPYSTNAEDLSIAETIYDKCTSECVEQLREDPSTQLLFGKTVRYNISILSSTLKAHLYTLNFTEVSIIEAPIKLKQMQARIFQALLEEWEDASDFQWESSVSPYLDGSDGSVTRLVKKSE